MIDQVFAGHKPAVIINLAAQAGVHYSIDYPDVYIESNLIGFYNILEDCRHTTVEHLVYASSFSVYGGNKKVPFNTDDRWIIPLAYTQPQRRAMSCWPTAIPSCTISHSLHWLTVFHGVQFC